MYTIVPYLALSSLLQVIKLLRINTIIEIITVHGQGYTIVDNIDNILLLPMIYMIRLLWELYLGLQ